MDLVGNNPGLSPLPSHVCMVPHIVSIMHMNKKPANGCYSTLIRIKNGWTFLNVSYTNLFSLDKWES